MARSRGLAGAGSYIVPLLNGRNSYRVTPTPPSPGNPPLASQPGEPGPPRVYASTPSVQEQLEAIRQKLH
jgi:hypothetical protein